MSEELTNAYQRIAELEGLVATMQKHRSEAGLNQVSLDAAHAIEDEFAKGHVGGRTQRLAKVQLIVRETLRRGLTGKSRWNVWHPGSFLTEPTQPELDLVGGDGVEPSQH